MNQQLNLNRVYAYWRSLEKDEVHSREMRGRIERYEEKQETKNVKERFIENRKVILG